MYFPKILSRKSERKQKPSCSDKYYTSVIDLPVWNWWQLHESGDKQNILLNRKSNVCELADQAIDLLHEDFIKFFGIDKKYAQYLRLQCDIELGYIQQHITGDKSTYLLLKAKEHELKGIYSSEKKAEHFSIIVALEKFLGRKIDTRSESVYDVYNYLNELSKWQKAKR